MEFERKKRILKECYSIKQPRPIGTALLIKLVFV
jgi:hypothetical protein